MDFNEDKQTSDFGVGTLERILGLGAGLFQSKLNNELALHQADLASARSAREVEVTQQNFLARLTNTDTFAKYIALAVVGIAAAIFLARKAR